MGILLQVSEHHQSTTAALFSTSMVRVQIMSKYNTNSISYRNTEHKHRHSLSFNLGMNHSQKRCLSTETMVNNLITITDASARRMNFLKAKRENNDLLLRIAVSAGGCSGFQYEFDFTNKLNIETEEDEILCHQNANFVIDKSSMRFLKGSKLDYVEDLLQKSFVIVDNPNVVSECGCNVSFSPTAELLEEVADEGSDNESD